MFYFLSNSWGGYLTLTFYVFDCRWGATRPWFLFKDGEKVDEYNKARDIDSFVKFLNEYLYTETRDEL